MDNPRNGNLESNLLEALKKRLELTRLTQRQAERALGMGHGAFGNILRGRTSLRFCHLELLAPVLGFTLEEILAEALGRPLPLEESDEDRFARRVAAQVVHELRRTR